MRQTFSFRKAGIISACLSFFLISPALAQENPSPYGLKKPSSAGGVKSASRARPIPKPKPAAEPKSTGLHPGTPASEPVQVQRGTRTGHQGRNTQRQNGQRYYPPQYPGPQTPLPPQGTYYQQSPGYGYGYGPNGYGYGYQYNNGGYYNNYQQRPSGQSGPGYVPFQGYYTR